MTAELFQNALQRAGIFRELPALLSERHVDPAEVYAGTGIDPVTLSASSLVPLHAMLTVLDRASRRLACPHLGLVLGARFKPDAHGPLWELMSAAPTLGRALADFAAWQHTYSNATVVYLNRWGEDAVVGFGVYDRRAPGTRQLYDSVVVIGCRMVEALTQGRVKPVEVLLAQSRPVDVAPYRSALPSPVRFDQEQTGLVIAADAMKLPLPGADPSRRKAIEAAIGAAMPKPFRTVSARTRHAIRPLLHDGRVSMAAVAAALSLHPRTLRRRLADEGTTFQTLIDEVRYTVARELLSLTGLPVAAIGAALAYSTHGTFISAFRRWSGETPSGWRTRIRAGVSPALPGHEPAARLDTSEAITDGS